MRVTSATEAREVKLTSPGLPLGYIHGSCKYPDDALSDLCGHYMTECASGPDGSECRLYHRI